MKKQQLNDQAQSHADHLHIQLGDDVIRLPKPDEQTYSNILYSLAGATIALVAVYVSASIFEKFR